MTLKRQPAGVPTGGQFAADPKGRSTVVLDAGWNHYGISAEERDTWQSYGWLDPDDTNDYRRIFRAEDGSFPAIEQWNAISMPPEQYLKTWHDEDIGPSDAKAFIDASIIDAEQAAAWKTAGYTPSVAAAHVNAGHDYPADLPPSDAPAVGRRDFDARSIGEVVRYSGPVGFDYEKKKRVVDVTGVLTNYTPNGRGGTIISLRNPKGWTQQYLINNKDLTKSRQLVDPVDAGASQ